MGMIHAAYVEAGGAASHTIEACRSTCGNRVSQCMRSKHADRHMVIQAGKKCHFA